MFKYVKKGDLLVIVLLFLGSIFFAYGLRPGGSEGSRTYASIQLEGKEVRRVDFSQDMVGEKIRIESPYGYNVFEVGDGKIRSIKSDCKEKVHIKQGWISQPGQTLVCLPHRLVVEIKTDEVLDGQIDHINY